MQQLKSINLNARSEIRFDDSSELTAKGLQFPTKIHCRRGEAIDAIQFEYNGIRLTNHGTEDGGDPLHFTLKEGVYITSFSVTSAHYWNNDFILSLTFHTNKGTSFGIPVCQTQQRSIKYSFGIEFPHHTALTCLYGGFAHPYEWATLVTNKLLLSSIGAYVAEYPDD